MEVVEEGKWPDRGWYVAMIFYDQGEPEVERIVRVLARHNGLKRIMTPDRRVALRFIARREDVPTVWPALSAARRLSSIRVYVNGEEVPSTGLWSLGCYARAWSSELPCENKRQLPWSIGCPQGNVVLAANHPKSWYLRARQVSESRFEIDVRELVEGFRARLGDFRTCPLLSFPHLVDQVERLPDSMDLMREKFWRVDTSGREPRLHVGDVPDYEQWLRSVLT